MKDFDDTIVGVDFNVPLRTLGYTRQNNRTEVPLEHLMKYSLSILNDSDAPSSFVQGKLSGRPELTLGGLNICTSLLSWEVDDRTFYHSDHRYIKIM